MTVAWGKIAARDLLTPLGGELASGSDVAVFSGVSTDSRTLKGGELFFALRGENFDGHQFVLKAAEKGAAGIVVEKDVPGLGPAMDEIRALGRTAVIAVQDGLKALGDLACWWRHQHAVQVVAVTGSAGKTTTKEMTAAILAQRHRTLKNPGNFNNLIGLPMTLLGLEPGHRMAVLEMGMNRFGEIGRLTEIADPDVGVITNVGTAHTEGVGGIEGVARAKTELVEKMGDKGQVILNGDDPLLMKTASALRKEVVTFGLGPACRIRGTGIRTLGPEGIAFHLHLGGETVPVRLQVPMLKNVMNALAAAAVGFGLGEPADRIGEGLTLYSGMKGRFSVSKLPGGGILIDDTYNANPSSLKAALESTRALAGEGGRIIVGLGDMLELGEETSEAHVKAGRLVAAAGDAVFFAVGEHAPEMVRGAVAGGIPKGRAWVVASNGEMIQAIREVLRQGDVILLKGSRRMHLEQVAEGLKERETIEKSSNGSRSSEV